MDTFYAAYGLKLVSSFPLAGMRPAAPAESDGPPALALALRDPREPDFVWSGSTAAPEWRGRLGDGRELAIERGSAGDLLFSYGGLARFRLDPDMRRLDCAPRQSGLDWQRALIGKVIPSISVMRGYEALHAAAVDSPEGVVAIMGASGAGKSTLALELMRRGWPLFADDQLTLSDDAGAVSAHPGTPHMSLDMRMSAELDEQALGATVAVLAGERWLAARASTERPRPVRMLCVLERGPRLGLELSELPDSPLALAPYMLGLSSEPERQRARFELYADLLQSAALVRLTAGSERPPSELADLLERASARSPGAIAGALA
ncbi:MAG TPA: hypothetical protein VMF09_03570 [Solirubrobacteraceae bacterium]|nr:hypothetical protein [Solirubrobacteraceae bacterium]